MASTWYVRPSISHSVTRNGVGYTTAWGGWSEIIWGGAGVKAGDTLYVCGAHSSATSLTVGNHASTPTSRAIIRGDYAPDPGSITFTGSAWLLVSISYSTIQNLTITAGTAYCIYLYGTPNTGTTIQGCTLNSSANMQIINIHGADNLAYVDLTIDGNSFNGGAGTGIGAAIQWLALAGGLTSARYLTRLKILNNSFTGAISNRSTISLTIEDGASSNCTITDLVVSGNTFQDCVGAAVVAYAGVFGRNTGIRITDNIIYNQTNKPLAMGGGFMIGGFGLSTTANFGLNIIARNKAYGLAGPTGFSNPFYGTYVYYDNYGEDISTDTIDGNGLLFDHGCADCIAYGNEFRRLTGTGVDGYYSGGFGILVLDATNITVYGNTVDGCVTGVGFGNKDTGQSANIFNNTFRNCFQTGAFVGGLSEKINSLVRNNIFTASRATHAVRNDTGAWMGESYNCFYGFSAPTNHTFAGTTKTVNPLIGSDGRPLAGSPLIESGTYLGGKGVDYKTFHNPPCIGAYEYVRPRSPRI